MLKLSAIQVQPPVKPRRGSTSTAVLWFYDLDRAFNQMQLLHSFATHGSGAHAALYTRSYICALGHFLVLGPAGRNRVATALFAHIVKARALNGLVDLALTCQLFLLEQQRSASEPLPSTEWLPYLARVNADLGNGRSLIFDSQRKQFKSLKLTDVQRNLASAKSLTVPLLADQNPIQVAGVTNSDEGICRAVVAVGSVIIAAGATAAAGYGVGRYNGTSGTGDAILYGVGGAIAAGGHQDAILDTLGLCGGASGVSNEVNTSDPNYSAGYIEGVKDAISGEVSQTDHTLDKSTWQSGYADGYNGVAENTERGTQTSINAGSYSAGFAAGFASVTGTSVATPSEAGFSTDYDQGVKDGQALGKSVNDDGASKPDDINKSDGGTTDNTNKSDDTTEKPDQEKDTVAQNDGPDKGAEAGTGNSTPNPDDPDGGHNPWSDVGFPDPEGSGGSGPSARQGFVTASQKMASGVALNPASFATATVKALGQTIQVQASFIR